jgi:hypothetical protein
MEPFTELTGFVNGGAVVGDVDVWALAASEIIIRIN